MHLGLDYDDTYTKAPAFWDSLIHLARAAGHRVSLVTYRDDRYDWTDMMTHLRDVVGIQIHCTRGVAKAHWMTHIAEDPVDVWIDDRPASITSNSVLNVEQLAIWREENAAKDKERPAA